MKEWTYYKQKSHDTVWKCTIDGTRYCYCGNGEWIRWGTGDLEKQSAFYEITKEQAFLEIV
jgi:hypothetical protein